MTSKVTVEAQSHPCEVRVMPRVGDDDLWKTLSDETRRFADHTIPIGETREYAVHGGQSVLVRELREDMPKTESNNHDEARATPLTSPPGRYLFRGNGFWDEPYEAELLEWSSGGRLKLGAPGAPRWLEGRHIPFVVEPITSGIETAGHDGATRHGAEHESPTAESGDAIPSSTPPSEPTEK